MATTTTVQCEEFQRNAIVVGSERFVGPKFTSAFVELIQVYF